MKDRQLTLSTNQRGQVEYNKMTEPHDEHVSVARS